MVTVDVRELSMPMPMMMILGKLDDLPEGHALFAHHKRIPVFLLPELEERGFEHRVREGAVLLAASAIEIGLNVVDLGLIYRIEFDEPASRITLTMTLSTPYCPVGETITAAVQRVLLDTFAGNAATIELTFQPPWSYDRISEAGKKYLST